MKKLLCIILAMLMLLSLAACGKDKAGSGDKGDGGKISLEDADVLAILNSIQPSEK